MQGGGLVQAAGVLAERGAADASLWLGNRRTWWLSGRSRHRGWALMCYPGAQGVATEATHGWSRLAGDPNGRLGSPVSLAGVSDLKAPAS